MLKMLLIVVLLLLTTLASAQSAFERVLVPSVESSIVLGEDGESRSSTAASAMLYHSVRDTTDVAAAYYYFRFDGGFPQAIGTATLRDVRLSVNFGEDDNCPLDEFSLEAELDYRVAFVDSAIDISRFTASAPPPLGEAVTYLRRTGPRNGYLVFEVSPSVVSPMTAVQFVMYVQPVRFPPAVCSILDNAAVYSASVSRPWLIATYYDEPAVRESAPMSWGSVKALYGAR